MGCNLPLAPLGPPTQHFHLSGNLWMFRNYYLYFGVYCFMEVKKWRPMLRGCLFLSFIWYWALLRTRWSWRLLQAKWGFCLLLNLRRSLLLLCYIPLGPNGCLNPRNGDFLHRSTTGGQWSWYQICFEANRIRHKFRSSGWSLGR